MRRPGRWRRRLVPLAALLLLAACADGPQPDGDIRLSGRERAQQVGRDVGAIVEGMRRAHALD